MKKNQDTAVAVRSKPSLMAKLGAKYGVDGSKLYETLKATAFKTKPGDPPASDAQLMALMVVSDQYSLNPFTREIFAFPDKQNGIVPVVGVDGWSRIINSNPEFDGMEFEQDDDSCTCRIHRKDRAHPTEVTEYLSECKRNTSPWGTHPKRMLRHKAMIQCARLAFGYVGIYDQDEAERILERDITGEVEVREPVSMPTPKPKAKAKAKPAPEPEEEPEPPPEEAPPADDMPNDDFPDSPFPEEPAEGSVDGEVAVIIVSRTSKKPTKRGGNRYGFLDGETDTWYNTFDQKIADEMEQGGEYEVVFKETQYGRDIVKVTRM